MKKILFLILLFCSTSTLLSQDKIGRPFFTGDVNFTLGINEHYEIGSDDDNGPLIVPSALLFRVGFGYEFKRKVAIAFNTGFDYHWNYAVSAFPTYGSLKYNISESDDDVFFTEVSYGKMWTPSSNYPDGNYYGIGFGVQLAGEERWNTIVRLDFHSKAIYGFENNRLDSISLGIGFSFF